MAHCHGIRPHVRRDGFHSFQPHFIRVAPLVLGETDQAGHVKVEGHSLVVRIAVLIVKLSLQKLVWMTFSCSLCFMGAINS